MSPGTRERLQASNARYTRQAGEVIVGFADLDSRFGGLELYVQSDVLGQAAKAACEPVLAAARAMAPRRSGRLESSLHIRKGRTRPGVFTWLVSTSAGFFGGDDYYAAFQEFGWRSGRRKSFAKDAALRDARRQVPGEHFLQYAADDEADASLEIFIRTMSSGIDREMGG